MYLPKGAVAAGREGSLKESRPAVRIIFTLSFHSSDNSHFTMHCRILLSFPLLFHSLNAMINFIPEVEDVKLSEGGTTVKISDTIQQDFVRAYQEADVRIFALDNGGVLQASNEIRGSPEQKRSVNDATKLLERLTADPKNDVSIVSARNSGLYFGALYPYVPNLRIAGSMAGHPILPRSKQELEVLKALHMSMPQDDREYDVKVVPELAYLSEQIGPISEQVDKIKSSLGWQSAVHPLPAAIIVHYEKDTHQKDIMEARLREMLNFKDFKGYVLTEPYKGDARKQFFSIAHKLSKKETYVQYLFQLHERQEKKIFALSIGDQAVDEGMHQIMNQHGQYSIVVTQSDKPTSVAKYSLPDHVHVKKFLNDLVDSVPPPTYAASASH